jgi:hypothetical protein
MAANYPGQGQHRQPAPQPYSSLLGTLLFPHDRVQHQRGPGQPGITLCRTVGCRWIPAKSPGFSALIALITS